MRKAGIYIDLSVFINLDYLTGIQRVSEEIILRLLKNKNTDVVLISYSDENECFRLINNDKFIECCENKIKDKTVCLTDKYIELNDMDSGDIFFDIDSVWCCKFKRSKLYPLLKNHNIKIVTHVYDIIPVTHPGYCHENTVMFFIEYLGAVLSYADRLIVNTQATADQISMVCRQMERKMPLYTVAPLGCDFRQAGTENKEVSLPSPDVSHIIESGKYILMVGTIEPRKNHALLLDALDNGLGINVVFAGRIGWNVEDLVTRIKNHPLFEKRLFFIDNANDLAIDKLYENAYLLAFPTFNEGFGLPVIESFQRNTPVIASDIPVLREVGQEFADYFDNTDCRSLIRYVDECLENPGKYNEKKSMLKNYKAYTWDKSADIMEKFLMQTYCGCDEINVKAEQVGQIIFICENKDNLTTTLSAVEKYMTFIKQILVCCPENISDLLKDEYSGKTELTVVAYSELINEKELPENYHDRCFLIRSLIIRTDKADDVFIMSDDNFRPLQHIPQRLFINDGKYIGYYFYDLRKWTGSLEKHTAFDKNAFKTREFLVSHGYPTLQYSSHQPQIVDKRIFREMLDMYPDIEKDFYDEWSMYFNFGIHHHPDIFAVKVNISMCWPDNFADWNLRYFPGPFFFENYNAQAYEENGVFGRFENISDCFENMQKSRVYTDKLRNQAEALSIYESFCRYYNEERGEYPSFLLYINQENNQVSLYVPEYICMKNNSVTHITLKIAENVYSYCDDHILNISYRFEDENNVNISSFQFELIDNGLDMHTLPVHSPHKRMNNGRLVLSVTVKDKSGNEISKEEKEIRALIV